jgi:hypothetical protein
MFDLTLVDHLRLTFGHVVYRQRLHAGIARSRMRWSRSLKALHALLLAAVVGTATGAAFDRGRAYAIGCAVCAGVLLLVVLLQLLFDPAPPAAAHHPPAPRLWRIRERYQALLSDIADGAAPLDAARRTRDALGDELRAIFEAAPSASDRKPPTHDIVTADDIALDDAEIDRLLPPSLHKRVQPAAGSSAA